MPCYSFLGAPAAFHSMDVTGPSHRDAFSQNSNMEWYCLGANPYYSSNLSMGGWNDVYTQQAPLGVHSYGMGGDGTMHIQHPPGVYSGCSPIFSGAQNFAHNSSASAMRHVAFDLDSSSASHVSTDLQVDYAEHGGQFHNNLFLSGIPSSIDDAAIRAVFSELGLGVQRSKILPGPGNAATCRALVMVASQKEAEQAIRMLNNSPSSRFTDVKDLRNCTSSKLQVEYATNPGEEWNNLFLKGVPNGANDVAIIGIFEELGLHAKRARMLRKHGSASCQAMVEVASREEAQQAILALNDRLVSDVFLNVAEHQEVPPHLLKRPLPLPILKQPTSELAGSYVDGPRLAVRYKGNSANASRCDEIYIGNLPAGELDGPTVRAALEGRGYTVRSCTVVADQIGHGFNSIVATLGSVEQTTLAIEELNRKSAQEFVMAMKEHAGRDFQYYCVVDFECTCDEINRKPHEIIEFPAVFVNTKTGKIEFEFHRYVRPTEESLLSPFCQELTGIQQEQVDAAQPLQHVVDEFCEFCAVHKLVLARSPEHDDERSFFIVTDGVADVAGFLRPECARKKIILDIGVWGRVFNMRSAYHKVFNMKGGVTEMLEAAGLSFEGRAHSGIDDARNISRLVERLVREGIDVRPNTDTGA